MKVIYTVLLLSILFTACQKKGNIADIAAKPASQNDSIVQVNSPKFIPYIDTFVYYYGYPSSTLHAYIYVVYPSPDTIEFTHISQSGSYLESFIMNVSNYYSGIYPLETENYKLIKDSLYYNDTVFDCSDTYITYIASKKINNSNRR